MSTKEKNAILVKQDVVSNGGLMSFIGLSDAEYEVMELLWSKGRPLCFREIMEHFENNTDKDWKKQTLNTFLFRMQQKGLIEAEGAKRYRQYFPLVSREAYVSQESNSFLKKHFQGSVARMLLAFSGGSRISKEDAAELKKIIEDWEEK